MTIYGYITNKEDLLDAIALRGLADLQLQRPLPSEPAAVLVAWGRALRATLIAHPSLPVIFPHQASSGPPGTDVLVRVTSAGAVAGVPEHSSAPGRG